MNSNIAHLQAEMIPCLRNADHVPPAGSDIREVEMCGGCGNRFLRHRHEPSLAEMSILKMLSECDAPKTYAFLKTILLDLRGSRYCRNCRISFTPVSSRTQ